MKKMMRMTGVACVLALLAAGAARGQGGAGSMPRIIEKNGRHALLVEGKPFFMLGGQAHNSSAWPGMMPRVWSAVEAMHANTLEVPIYWEQIEPQPGQFDFSLVDMLLQQAREHKVHLVLLWFGTWKNGSNHYMPEWMKHDAAKYPNITGRNGQPVDSPSPHTQAAMDLDAKVFAAVMTHLKEADPQHTVLLVQVENEPGAWGGDVRDYSAAAQKLFAGPVPAEMLQPGLLKALNKPPVDKGTWQEVFGNDADEYFHAYSVAHYIGQVAAAGKSVNALPLYVNAALRDPLSNPRPGTYESGGPTDNVIPIWKVAAPAIDLVCPDIYLAGSPRYLKVLELYDRPDNTLFVPETSASADNAKYIYSILARGGIGFSPFGIDSNTAGSAGDEANAARLAPIGQEYAVIAPMMRELAQWGFEGKLKAAVELEDHAGQTIDLDAWKAVVTFGAQGRRGGGAAATPAAALGRGRRGAGATTTTTPMAATQGGFGAAAAAPPAAGKLLVAQLGENEFVTVGSNCRLTFQPTGANAGKAWQYLKVEEGRYENGTFKRLRIRNGDETDGGGPRFGSEPVVLHVTLVTR